MSGDYRGSGAYSPLAYPLLYIPSVANRRKNGIGVAKKI
jgi:hypothetical protein